MDYIGRLKWILTDDSTYQYVRKINDNTFAIIEMSILDEKNGIFEVYKDEICMGDYIMDAEMKNELVMILKTYGYSGIGEVILEYGDESLQIMAECIFEYYGSFQADRIFSGKEKDCVDFIKNYLLHY